MVDHEDGRITLKKLEERLNTFTPALTYLLRCNSDVSSLESGTAIKAIISYVTDYITKPALKTHQIFSSAYDIFDKASEDLFGEMPTKVAARKLVLKIVNALTSKMEIGSSTAAMYLLGNPDHYTSHDFVPFWWRSYVSEVNRQYSANTPPTENSTMDVVILGKEGGEIVAKSVVDDYIFRPLCFEGMSLLKWVQLSDKRRIPKGKQTPIDEEVNCEDEWEDVEESCSADIDTDSYRAFLPGHPLHETHEVRVLQAREHSVIPNYLGGKLPRRDQGDREYYCMTMLTLFKPWRSVNDLTDSTSTWDENFVRHEFEQWQTAMMANFHLRYECLDDRDNYHRMIEQETAKKRKLKSGGWFNSNDAGEQIEDVTETDYTEMATKLREDLAHDRVGIDYRRKLKQMEEVEQIMKHCGWTNVKVHKDEEVVDAQIDGVSAAKSSDVSIADKPWIFPVTTPTGWKNVVKSARELLISLKRQSMSKNELGDGVPEQSNSLPLQADSSLVKVVDAEYIRKDFRAKDKRDQQIIDDTVILRKLNKEQERALRIVANHATGKDYKQLTMYLGGMGGTGKSQVIKSIIDMFGARKEMHRFIVLAPTGTAAALLKGST
ncbi:hypothetical protein BKA70DRAFT_1121558, partial [Coprinopsis sp. MPI-PUGE-AT-0042]